jgi:hypothetical protein
MPKKPQPVSLDKLLEKFFRDKGQEQKYRELKVFEVWEKVMGGEIRSNAAPVSINQGRLVVSVRNSVWLTELGFTRQKIKTKLNRNLGKGTVTDISFRIGPVPEPAAARHEEIKPSKFKDPALAKKLDRMLASVHDESLRKSLKDWFAAIAGE